MEERMEFALKAMRTLNFRALCQEYGVSAKTGYKWKERFLREGLAGMVEESRRPRNSPGSRLPEEAGVRDRAFEIGALVVGATQDSGIISAAARRSGQ